MSTNSLIKHLIIRMKANLNIQEIFYSFYFGRQLWAASQWKLIKWKNIKSIKNKR